VRDRNLMTEFEDRYAPTAYGMAPLFADSLPATRIAAAATQRPGYPWLVSEFANQQRPAFGPTLGNLSS